MAFWGVSPSPYLREQGRWRNVIIGGCDILVLREHLLFPSTQEMNKRHTQSIQIETVGFIWSSCASLKKNLCSLSKKAVEASYSLPEGNAEDRFLREKECYILPR
jgi:hypothetical protein